MLCDFKNPQIYITTFVLMAGLLWCAEGTADDETFNYTGAQQTWVVPAGVTSITIDATGARGGGTGGLGAKATGTYTVTPAETLYIYVGGKGVGLSGGFNGGGNGDGGYTGDGTGGGGASDVRQGGTALANRIIVGGGGGGNSGDGAVGGAGGTPNGSDSGGGGGTTSGGGAGQAGDCGSGVTGVLGIGGTGGGGYCTDYGGGGGGGGYYGGGGGGDGFGGGGGGGGGSSNVLAGTSTSYTAGAGTDHGQVVITYTPAASGPLKGAVMIVK